jgi:hypothetical protein
MKKERREAERVRARERDEEQAVRRRKALEGQALREANDRELLTQLEEARR